MNKALMFVFFTVVASILFDIHNTVSQLRNVGTEITSDAEYDETFVEGEKYGVVPVRVIVGIGGELTSHNPKQCGKYFYTIQYRNKAHIGFQLPSSATAIDTRRIQGNFLKDKYRVIIVDYDYSSPTVEFDGNEIIVRINRTDLREALCFREHTII